MSNGWVVKTQVEYNYNTDKKENKKRRKQGGGSGGGAAQAWGTSPPRGRPGCEERRETFVYIQYYQIQVVMFQFQNKFLKKS